MKISEIKSWGLSINNILLNNGQLIPDALIGLRLLTQKTGKENVWLVTDTQISNIFLDKFKEATTLPKQQVLTVTSLQDKITVIKSLELDAFIDTEGMVLSSLDIKCPIWFNPSKSNIKNNVQNMNMNVRVVGNWRHFLEIF